MYKNEKKYKCALKEYLENKNITISYLSKKYHFDRNCFSRYLKNNNIDIKPIVHSFEKENILLKSIDLYKQGNSIRKISKMLNISEKTISKYLKENNIKIKKFEKFNIQYNFNENFFENIDNEKNAYWLGFLMADGCISIKNKNYKISILLNSIDKIHLQKFLNDIQSNHIIISKNRNNKEYSKVEINSKKMVLDLINKGCIPQKTYKGFINVKCFNTINEKIAFLRGFLDGDGFISKNRYNIVYTIKSEKITETICNFLNEINIYPKCYLDNKNIYRISIYNKNDFFNLLNILYKNATIYLDRKYMIYKARISPLL